VVLYLSWFRPGPGRIPARGRWEDASWKVRNSPSSGPGRNHEGYITPLCGVIDAICGVPQYIVLHDRPLYRIEWWTYLPFRLSGKYANSWNLNRPGFQVMSRQPSFCIVKIRWPGWPQPSHMLKNREHSSGIVWTYQKQASESQRHLQASHRYLRWFPNPKNVTKMMSRQFLFCMVKIRWPGWL
jgi:hypothetical protein